MVLTTLFAALALVQEPVTVTNLSPAQGAVVTRLQEKKISTNFNNASLKDVLNFLHKQKVDFAVDPDQFKDRKISLSLSDVPVSTALTAIASALDAHWETVGGVKVLKKGFGSSFGGGAFVMPRSFDQKMFELKGLEGKNFDFKAFDKEHSQEMRKAMEEMRKAMADQKFEFKGLDKAQTEEIQKAMEEARKAMANQKFEFKGLDKAQSEEMKRAMESARKAMADQKFEFKGLDKAQTEEIQKAMEEARKAMANQKFEFKKLDGKEWPKGAFILKGQNFGDLTKSITPAQKELQKKQGYLKVSDLTPEQRKLAGISGDGKGAIEITITRDGETLKIKGE